MSETARLIDQLARDAKPVRRLARPGWRAAFWLALAGLAGAWLAGRADLPAMAARLAGHADMWLAVVGSVATAITASVAAMLVALPDRDGRWAWLPVPAALLWLAASGAGCLRADLAGLWHPASYGDATVDCLPFILRTSAFLAPPLELLLWRARPLRMALTAWLGGLATAAGAASLLWLFHPFEPSLADLLVHMVAVGVVMGVCRLAAVLVPDG